MKIGLQGEDENTIFPFVNSKELITEAFAKKNFLTTIVVKNVACNIYILYIHKI